jgi:hypothetical protein
MNAFNFSISMSYHFGYLNFILFWPEKRMGEKAKLLFFFLFLEFEIWNVQWELFILWVLNVSTHCSLTKGVSVSTLNKSCFSTYVLYFAWFDLSWIGKISITPASTLCSFLAALFNSSDYCFVKYLYHLSKKVGFAPCDISVLKLLFYIYACSSVSFCLILSNLLLLSFWIPLF